MSEPQYLNRRWYGELSSEVRAVYDTLRLPGRCAAARPIGHHLYHLTYRILGHGDPRALADLDPMPADVLRAWSSMSRPWSPMHAALVRRRLAGAGAVFNPRTAALIDPRILRSIGERVCGARTAVPIFPVAACMPMDQAKTHQLLEQCAWRLAVGMQSFSKKNLRSIIAFYNRLLPG